MELIVLGVSHKTASAQIRDEVQVHPEEMGEFYARVPMKVELSGRFHQIARFFYNVGQLDRIINMENISMTDPSSSEDEVVLRTEALATAFHILEPEVAAQAAANDSRKARRGKQKGK